MFQQVMFPVLSLVLVTGCSVASRNSVEVVCEAGFTGIDCAVEHVSGPDRTWSGARKTDRSGVRSGSDGKVGVMGFEAGG